MRIWPAEKEGGRGREGDKRERRYFTGMQKNYNKYNRTPACVSTNLDVVLSQLEGIQHGSADASGLFSREPVAAARRSIETHLSVRWDRVRDKPSKNKNNLIFDRLIIIDAVTRERDRDAW